MKIDPIRLRCFCFQIFFIVFFFLSDSLFFVYRGGKVVCRWRVLGDGKGGILHRLIDFRLHAAQVREEEDVCTLVLDCASISAAAAATAVCFCCCCCFFIFSFQSACSRLVDWLFLLQKSFQISSGASSGYMWSATIYFSRVYKAFQSLRIVRINLRLFDFSSLIFQSTWTFLQFFSFEFETYVNALISFIPLTGESCENCVFYFHRFKIYILYESERPHRVRSFVFVVLRVKLLQFLDDF